MVLMYGTPPDVPSPRFEPQNEPGPSPVTSPMPGVQSMPPITHNPFTGEPVNLLEILAQNAVLTDENKRLKEFVEKQLETLKTLQQKITDLTTELIPQRKKTGVPCAFPGGCPRKARRGFTMCGKHQPIPAKKR